MPRHDKEADEPIVQIDDSYVQALKIRSLEARNEELRHEAERLKAYSGEVASDRQDVFEHLERDNRAKAAALHELTAQLKELRQEFDDERSRTANEMMDARANSVAEREQFEAETALLQESLDGLLAVQHNKERFENRISGLTEEVDDLKERHAREMGDVKHEFDLKVAALHADNAAKLEATEASVEARAMTRVDEVTRTTLVVNSRRLLEIENLHREIGQASREYDRMEKENKAIKFEVGLKRVEVRELQDKSTNLKQTIAHQAETMQEHSAVQATWQSLSDRGDKQTLILQMMVRTLEDKVAQQARQVQHYQSRLIALERPGGANAPAPSLPAIHKANPKAGVGLPAARDKPQVLPKP
ncbi:hypothetical protein T484DRAFT_3283642 [Baffinella frigidus]|nr:hypothetical protein T484DRAFT_3283642 [Cryptophyta sp. CCMP2293]